MKLFSNRNRPFHLGPFPLERLARAALPPPDDGAERPTRPAPDVLLAGKSGLDGAKIGSR